MCVHVHVCIHKHHLQIHHPEFSSVRLGIKSGLKERWVVSIGLVPFRCSDMSVWLQRLLVCLEESIYIHNIKDMKLLKTILDVPANPTGELPNETGAPSSRVQVPLSLSWEPEAVVLLYKSSWCLPWGCVFMGAGSSTSGCAPCMRLCGPHGRPPPKLLSSVPVLSKCVRVFEVDAWEIPCIWYGEVFTPNYLLWLLSTE